MAADDEPQAGETEAKKKLDTHQKIEAYQALKSQGENDFIIFITLAMIGTCSCLCPQ